MSVLNAKVLKVKSLWPTTLSLSLSPTTEEGNELRQNIYSEAEPAYDS